MNFPKRSAEPAWPEAGLWAGLITSIHVPIIVLLVWALPHLRVGYPLVLLPLLMAGPLATRGLAPLPSSAAALVAGVVSACVAVSGLALGSLALGTSLWGLTSAASAPPMPPLPRLTVLPAELLTWAQQDVLFFQPLLALTLSLLAILARPFAGPDARLALLLLPRSLSARLILAFGGLAVLTFLVGWVSFSALEEMHFRGHRLQLEVDWQRHLSEANEALLAEQLSRAQGDEAAALAKGLIVDAAYDHLSAATVHPGIALGMADIRASLARYEPALRAAPEAQAAYRAQPDEAQTQALARTSLATLRQQVDARVVEPLGNDDLAHHQRLIVVMAAVGLAGALGVLLAQRTVAAIDRPIRGLAAHLQRVAHGEFQRRVPIGGPVELRGLAAAVNSMTADLDRLYAAERDGRARAEAMAVHERELAGAKEFWTNTVVHDLKEPLTIVAGWAEMLETGTLGPLAARQQEAVGDLRRASDDLLGLVADINDSFRLEASALPLNLEPVGPAEALRTAAAEQAYPDRPAPVVRLSGPTLPVLADPRLLHRVLRNLIGNAYKHAGPRASVTLSSGARDGMVWFMVQDNGPGIPTEQLGRVFERFAQGTCSAPGSGLGLAFCKLVVEQHGGRIWAEARPGGGARIYFALAAAREMAAAPATAPSSPTVTTFRRSAAPGLTPANSHVG